jgi:hypothetical protein
MRPVPPQLEGPIKGASAVEAGVAVRSENVRKRVGKRRKWRRRG